MTFSLDDARFLLNASTRLNLREFVFSVKVGEPITERRLDEVAGLVDRLLDWLFVAEEAMDDAETALMHMEKQVERDKDIFGEWNEHNDTAADLLAVEVDAYEQMGEPIDPQGIRDVIHMLKNERP